MAKKRSLSRNTSRIPSGQIQLSNETKKIRCRILIVCEGTKTEPNYFKSFDAIKMSNSLVPEIKACGTATNTIQVVEEAIRLKKDAEDNGTSYDSVWAVFDKDNFPDSDFNNAILKADRNGVGCAWSNEAFELWYIYHFDAYSTPISRSQYQDIITRRVRENSCDKTYTYRKNDSSIRDILRKCGCDEKKAIQRAENQANTFVDQCFGHHNPCTMVYKLVRQLIGEDKEFVKRINERLGEK